MENNSEQTVQLVEIFMNIEKTDVQTLIQKFNAKTVTGKSFKPENPKQLKTNYTNIAGAYLNVVRTRFEGLGFDSDYALSVYAICKPEDEQKIFEECCRVVKSNIACVKKCIADFVADCEDFSKNLETCSRIVLKNLE